jgi:hypothetical protein
MAKRQHVLEHRFIRLRRDRAKPPRLETHAQDRSQPFGSIEALLQQIALPPALRQFGAQPPAAGQPGHDVAEEESKPHYGDNSLAVSISREGRVATLWHLTWEDDRVSCAVYRGAEGMQLRLESPRGVIMSEPFDMQPRAFARTRTLRESLKRRGWQEIRN